MNKVNVLAMESWTGVLRKLYTAQQINLQLCVCQKDPRQTSLSGLIMFKNYTSNYTYCLMSFGQVGCCIVTFLNVGVWAGSRYETNSCG